MIITLCPNPSIDKIIHLDQFHLGKVNKCIDQQLFPGGKGVHVALALKQLGSDSEIIGFWGGPTGEWIKKECNALGVSCLGPVLLQWSRTCITMLTKSEANNTEIIEKGPTVKLDALHTFFEATRSEIVGAEAVCVSGSWPVKSPNNVYERLKSISESKKKEIWVDASGDRLMQAIKAEPFGIHINKKEASDFFGEQLTPIEYTKKLLKTCQVVALTDGANGLFLGHNNSIIHSTCSVENIVSTVGSGDCLTAGLMHAWYNNESPEEAAKTATACGAANCVHPNLGMLCKKDVERFKEKVVLKTVYTS